MNHEWPPAVHKTMTAIDEVAPIAPDLDLLTVRPQPQRRSHALAIAVAVALVGLSSAVVYLIDTDQDSTASPETTLGQSTTQATTIASTVAGSQLATLRIPAIDVTAPILAGLDPDTLAKAVGHLSSSPQPGQQGNAVLEGHRTVGASPFFDLDKLQVGDAVIVDTASGGHFEYTVTETIEFDDNQAAQAARPTGADAPTLTLYTCTPAYTAKNRLAVYAVLDPSRSDEPGFPSSTSSPDDSPTTGLTC